MSKNTNLSFLTDYITADITNGRIGINNASPAYSFDVTGIARTSTSTYLATASGNVGIGTSSPAYKLTVSDNISADLGFQVRNLTSGYGTAIWITGNSNAGTAYNGIFSNTNGGSIQWYIGGDGIENTLITKVNGSERMRITAAGNLNLYDQKHQLAFYNAGNFQINFGQYYNGTSQIATNTDGGRLIMVDGGFKFNTFTGGTVNSTVADSERMRILANGNVGIGYSAPTNKLEVNGNGYFNGTMSTGGNVVASGSVQGATLIANSAIYTYNVQQYYYGNTFTFTPPNMLNSGVDNSNMRIYMIWIWGVNGPTEAGVRVWMVAVNGPGTSYTANEILGRDANGGTGLNIYRSSATQISINSNNNAFIKFVSVMQLATGGG